MNLSVKEAARLLSVSEKTVYRWIKQERIPAYRLSDQYRFNKAELLEWATSHRISVAPEMFEEPESSGTLLPTLAEALEEGGIYYRIEGKNRKDALASVVQHMRLPGEVDPSYLLQVLIARERLASTGVGEGIAIPRVRHPELLYLPGATLTLCFLEHPVDFKALDGEPVRVLFALVAPTQRAHLQILSRLNFVLKNPEFKRVLQQQGSREEIMSALRAAEKLLKA